MRWGTVYGQRYRGCRVLLVYDLLRGLGSSCSGIGVEDYHPSKRFQGVHLKDARHKIRFLNPKHAVDRP